MSWKPLRIWNEPMTHPLLKDLTMRHRLNDTQKAFIVDGYTRLDYTQDQLAAKYNVSRRTIQRVLLEKKIICTLNRVTDADLAILNAAKAAGIQSAQHLHTVIHAPALTRPNVERFLALLSHDELATIFYNSALAKIAEVVSQGQQLNGATSH